MIGLIRILVLMISLVFIPGLVFGVYIGDGIICGRTSTFVSTDAGKWTFPHMNVAYIKVSNKGSKVGLLDGTVIKLNKKMAQDAQGCMIPRIPLYNR